MKATEEIPDSATPGRFAALTCGHRVVLEEADPDIELGSELTCPTCSSSASVRLLVAIVSL